MRFSGSPHSDTKTNSSLFNYNCVHEVFLFFKNSNMCGLMPFIRKLIADF